MKKYLVGLIAVLALVVVPNFVLATSGDIDPQGDSSCVSINNNLRYRANDANTNGEVSVLQDFLQTNGYLQSNPVGFFGLMTTAAVKSFQSANGITSTGYVGPITREKIKTQTCSGQVGSTNAGSSTISGCASGAVFSATTGQSCVAVVAVQVPTTSGCAVGAVYSATTGAPCASTLNGISSTPTIVTPPATIISSPTTINVGGSAAAGCSVGMVFSATTGAPCTTTSNGSHSMEYNPSAPIITSVTSKANPAGQFYPGDMIIISGSNFNPNVDTTVWIGGDRINVVKGTYGYTNNSIALYTMSTMPPGTYDLYITNNYISNKVSVTVLYKSTPQVPTVAPYDNSPVISSINPIDLKAGTAVVVTGKNFDSSSILTIDGWFPGNVSTTLINPTSLGFTVPSNIKTGHYNLRVFQNAGLGGNLIPITITN